MMDEEERQKAKTEGGNKMEGYTILALALAIPTILFPLAYVWGMTIGGICAAVRRTHGTRAARTGGADAAAF